MLKIAVSVESSADVPTELREKYDIKVIPYQITLGDETFYDGEKSPEEMFALVDKFNQLPKTTAINEYVYREYFGNLKKDYDAVVHICLSGGITSSCGNAVRAASGIKNVFVVDSKSLSMGTGVLALCARDLANNGYSPAEIAENLSATTGKIVTSFIIERLDYLHKGGRCSSIALLGANLLKIRPRIILKNGTMISDKKYRGNMAYVVGKFAEELISEFPPDRDTACISYTTATPEMLNAAAERCRQAGFKNVILARAGATISSHCGENTLGIFYIGK